TAVAPSVDSLLSIGRAYGETTAEEEAWSAAELGRISTQVRDAIARRRDVAAAIALNETVFGTLGFVREVEQTDLRFVLLPAVLRSRRGSCVGLGALYLGLAQSLKIPMEGVMRPGHFYVRVREADRHRNIELLRQGEEMPDSWYETRFPAPSGANEYGRGLSPSEVLGVVEYDIGNERRRQGRIAEARRAYDRAVHHFADFAEAHASLGTALHLLGALNEAEASYEAARRINPHLAGLDKNIELLQQERAGDARAP
ncbi:MAG TPA: transglutaminase family protein, partial [Polyangiaceae bacterium]|nr:transglutaminase family protein [Polyangiaceae bacterium]